MKVSCDEFSREAKIAKKSCKTTNRESSNSVLQVSQTLVRYQDREPRKHTHIWVRERNSAQLD